MRDFLRRFMLGRYGPDQLCIAMIILSFALSLLYAVLGYLPLLFLSYISFGLTLFRMLSRNIYRRRAENDKFIRYWWPIKTRTKRLITRIKESRTHRFYKCPKCKKTLRVPRGKGQIHITCPKCAEQFYKKT